ncbi:MAG: serine O-acetyltransferase [Alphaproteobacteria bacterium CG_4_9_14_3_um_filter_47_13]|nr:MAG: serine O-acetyltransferase [Alphaproteobacteria bacterium CG_4_9_14_3_um_filter_47_13]
MCDLIDSIRARDPARPSFMEVVLAYPGVHALVIHRVAHWIWTLDIKGFKPQALARVIAHGGRLLTGIEIHPGAKIGKRLFIDHGMGLVIGETAEIGDDVTLYHGVTLGGKGGDLPGSKRHPTLENGVMIGANAQVLGAVTIGSAAKIGAGALVTSSVPSGCVAIGNPARLVNCKSENASYGLPDTSDDLDPVGKTINGLLADINAIKAQLDMHDDPVIQKDNESTYADLWKSSGI